MPCSDGTSESKGNFVQLLRVDTRVGMGGNFLNRVARRQFASTVCGVIPTFYSWTSGFSPCPTVVMLLFCAVHNGLEFRFGAEHDGGV